MGAKSIGSATTRVHSWMKGFVFNQWVRWSVQLCSVLQVKESQQMKVVFSEQLSKLQTKQHQDSELLEEIRYCEVL